MRSFSVAHDRVAAHLCVCLRAVCIEIPSGIVYMMDDEFRVSFLDFPSVLCWYKGGGWKESEVGNAGLQEE